MANWFTDVTNKLIAMKQYCIDQSNISCAAINKANSITRYTIQFNDLIAAIDAYKLDKAGKQSQLRDLIMMDFANSLIGNITYDPPIFKPTEPYPVGYSEYWDLYSMNGLAASIIGMPTSYFFEGCIISVDGTTTRLQDSIAAATAAEAEESVIRAEAVNFVRSYPILNSLIYLTENFTIIGSPKTKTLVSTEIYMTKHAKEIIDSFGLNVYVPSYLL